MSGARRAGRAVEWLCALGCAAVAAVTCLTGAACRGAGAELEAWALWASAAVCLVCGVGLARRPAAPAQAPDLGRRLRRWRSGGAAVTSYERGCAVEMGGRRFWDTWETARVEESEGSVRAWSPVWGVVEVRKAADRAPNG